MQAGQRVPERAAAKKRQRGPVRTKCSCNPRCRQDLTMNVDSAGRRYPVCTGHLGEFVTKQLASQPKDAVITVRWREMKPVTSIRCPECGKTSHHPEDVKQGYCGNCHAFTSPPNGRRV